MKWQERITIDPRIHFGKPIVRGTRHSVEFVTGLLAQGWNENQVLRNYPELDQDDIKACIQYKANSQSPTILIR
ncbi:MAG: hypothetical protein HFACDABA_03041 [Anaerolineales bacterium]|nr:hypothetical protein [Anaerolineales bacterium]